MKKIIEKNKKHIFKVFISFFVLIVFLKWSEVDDFSIIRKSLSVDHFWIGCFLLIAMLVIKTFRFKLLIEEYGIRIDFKKNLLIHFATPVLGLVTPSNLGEGVKILMIGDEKKNLGFCFLLEKLMDLGVLSLISLLVIVHYGIFVDSVYVITAFLSVAIVGLVFFDKIFNRLFKKKLEANWFLMNLKKFIKKRHLFTLILTVFSWIVYLYAIYHFSLIFENGFKSISFIDFASIIAVATIIGAISALPGGTGSREVVVGILFYKVFLIDLKTTGVFSLLNLFAHYFTFTIIGIISYTLLKVYYPKMESKIEHTIC